MSNQLRTRYDIIINGGGIVGFTLLNLILKSPYLNRCKVLLIEQASKPAHLSQPARLVERSSDSEWNQSNSESYDDKRFSNRVSSITNASKFALKNLNVWNTIKPFAKDVKSIKVWNYDYSHKIVFNQNASHGDSLENVEDKDIMFSVVENDRLTLALLDNICKHGDRNGANITWNFNLQHMTESPEPGLVSISAKNAETGEEVHADAPLVLGCDGFKSKVRELTKMHYTELSLNKTAVVGTVEMVQNPERSSDENNIAYQRFSADKDTVAALLPLDREYSSFVISAPNEYSKYLKECDDETFITEFNRLLSNTESPKGAILRGFHNVSNSTCDSLSNLCQSLFSSSNGFPRATSPPGDSAIKGFDEPPYLDSVVENSRAMFPLFFGTTTPRMIASLPSRQYHQIALLGDSSHRVHPLAGQGLNLGIQDAIELVKQLEGIAKCGERIFDGADTAALQRALKKYECKRQAYIMPMSAGILSMPHLFKLLPSRLVSNVNKCDSIKSTSVRFANGC